MKYLNLFLVATLVSSLAGADDQQQEQDIESLDFLPLAGDLVDAGAGRPRKLKVFPAVPSTHNSDVFEAAGEAAESHEVFPIEEDLTNEIPPVEEDPEESYEVPSESYETPPATEVPPAEDIPDIPEESNEVPSAPAESYEVPSSPTESNEVPSAPAESYEVPSAPAESYEVPATSETTTTPVELPEIAISTDAPVDVVHIPEHLAEIPSFESVPAVCTPVCWDECHVVERVLWSERPTSACSHVWKRAAEAGSKRPCFVIETGGRWRRDAHYSADKRSRLALCEQRAAVPVVCPIRLVRERTVVPEKICRNTCRQSC